MDTRTLDKNLIIRNESPEDIEIIGSWDSHLVTANGREYIDFLMGWCVGNSGWGNKEIKKSISRFAGPAYVYPYLLYRPWTELAELLVAITPGKLKKCFRTTGGTESIEAAMQIAMCYTGRYKFISIEGSYHGNSIGALSIGASESRKQFKNLLPNCFKVETPLDAKALKKIESRLKKKDIAAFIMEPIICNLGVFIPSPDFMQTLAALCKKYGTLLVMDEVATGFGRTGKLFASEHFELEPDILCLSKAITGGYAGLGATLTTEEIAQEIKGKFSFYSTYGWHPLSVETAIANIQYILKHKKDLLDHVATMSYFFRTRLNQMKFRGSIKINVIGLAIAVEMQSEYASRIQDKCKKKGLLLGADENGLTLFPSLNIEEKTAQKGLDILEMCL